MHLVPADRAGRRVIDGSRVCEAISGIGDPAQVSAWASRFAVLADPNRLTLLLCIHAAGPISVSDLAVAADMNDTTVSQALRLLRANGIVTAHRTGRVIRYQLTDHPVHQLLHHIRPPADPVPGDTTAAANENTP